MKISYQALEIQLKKQLEACYWINGDEPLLLQEAVDAIRKTAKAQGYKDRQIHYADNNHFNWQDLRAGWNNLSLFAHKSVEEVRLGEKKVPDPKGREQLLAYLENPAVEKCIIMTSAKIDTQTTKTKWFQQLEKLLVFIQVWPLQLSELPKWIQSRLSQYEIAIDSAGIQLLADWGEGNLLALKQNLQKLALLYPKQKITYQQITEAMSDHGRFDLFNLADEALAGHPKRVLRMLQGMKQEGIEAILILWALARDIRMLNQISEYVAQGEDVTIALRRVGVWAKRIPVVKTALQRQVDWKQLLSYAAVIDHVLKGAESGDGWLLLEQLVLAMHGLRIQL